MRRKRYMVPRMQPVASHRSSTAEPVRPHTGISASSSHPSAFLNFSIQRRHSIVDSIEAEASMEILKAFGNTERTLQKKEPKGCEYCVLGKSLLARLECAYELESCCHLGGDISDPVFGFVGGRRGSGPLQIKVFGLSRRNR